jgi:glc operon protein GlcG
VIHPETGFDISFYGDPRYVGIAGGVPVMVDGAIAVAVGVSGLSEDEDEEVVALDIVAIEAAAPSGKKS